MLASSGSGARATVDVFDEATAGRMRSRYKDATVTWELRGGARYFYKSVSTGGRSVKRYFGKGPVGELASYFDDLARQREAAQAEALRAEVARQGPPEAAMRALDVACRLMVDLTLWANAYHRSSYHWRRRRARSSP